MSAGAVEQQRIEELCAAAIRALSGAADVHFRGRRLYRGGAPIPRHAPHLQVDEADSFDDQRGAGDGTALKIRYSDAALHRTLVPSDEVARLVFEMLEQFRVESMVTPGLRGVRRNLELRFERWSSAFVESGLADTDLGLLLFATAQICRARVLGGKVADPWEDLLEPTRAGMAPLIGHDLAGLRATRQDQAAFAVHARSIALIVSASVDHAESSRDQRAPRNDARRAIFNLSLDFDETEGESFETAGSTGGREPGAAAGGYRVYTRAYDTQLEAESLVRPALLETLRRDLDRRVAAHGLNVPRLARLIKTMLARPRPDGFSFGEESGVIDGRRLSQLVASPGERRLFRQDRRQPRADCRFTVLVDCSGSMKQYVNELTCLVDVLARALEQAGVESELLGFTTGAWSGGRAQRDWLRAGRPDQPGRLNETCHLVFKDAATPWRRSRRAIAALGKADLFREGVDGEAVDWAARRLAAADVERRVLLVVSDGSPMDTATALANDAFYLDAHLRRVVRYWRESGAVEIMGLGVGLDLSPYYERSLAVDLDAGLSHQLFFDLLEVLRGHHRR